MKFKIFGLLFFLIILSIISRTYKLDVTPPGLSNDEVNIGYDAYSVLKTGRDQWGHFLPLSFKGFGDYRLPVFTYASIPAIKIFGLNAFGLRIPSVIFAIAAILGTFLLGLKMFDWKSALIASFFLSFSPWFFGMNRVAIESPVGVFFTVWGVLFFLLGKRKIYYLIPSAIFLALSMYSYYTNRYQIPIFLLLLVLVDLKNFKEKKKNLLIFLFTFFIFTLPIIFLTIYSGDLSRFKQVLLINDIGIINDINTKRLACAEVMPYLMCKLAHNKFVDFTVKYSQNYLAHFSPELFIKSFSSAQAVTPPTGLFLFIELPFFILGAYKLLKFKIKDSLILFIWLLLAPFSDSMTSSGHYSRFLFIYPSFQLISAFGLVNSLKTIIPSSLVVLVTSLNIFIFFVNYFGNYRFLYSRSSHYEYIPLFKTLLQQEKNYDRIYLSRGEYDTKHYIFYLFFSRFDPVVYQSGKDIERLEDEKEWIDVRRIGKWHFVKQLPESNEIPENSLIVGGKNEFKAKNITNFELITHLNGDAAFYLIKNCSLDIANHYLYMEELYNRGQIENLLPISCYY